MAGFALRPMVVCLAAPARMQHAAWAQHACTIALVRLCRSVDYVCMAAARIGAVPAGDAISGGTGGMILGRRVAAMRGGAAPRRVACMRVVHAHIILMERHP